MEKSEGVGDSNFPPKKNLARQLDFNAVGGSAPAPPVPAMSTVVLPEHPHRPVVVPPPQLPHQPQQPLLRSV